MLLAVPIGSTRERRLRRHPGQRTRRRRDRAVAAGSGDQIELGEVERGQPVGRVRHPDHLMAVTRDRPGQLGHRHGVAGIVVVDQPDSQPGASHGPSAVQERDRGSHLSLDRWPAVCT